MRTYKFKYPQSEISNLVPSTALFKGMKQTTLIGYSSAEVINWKNRQITRLVGILHNAEKLK